MANEKRDVVRTLERIALATDLSGGNGRGFVAAAQAIRRFEGDLRAAVESGELAKARGIGPATVAVVREVLDGRTPERLVALGKTVPEGLFEVAELRGLGPAKVKRLWEGLGITTLGELEYACQENRLVELDGFGSKTQEKVLAAIAERRRHEGWFRRDAIREVLALLPVSPEGAPADALPPRREHGGAWRVAGDFRRGAELVQGVVLASPEGRDEVARVLREAEDGEPAVEGGVVRHVVRGVPVEVHACDARRLGLTVLRLTGPDAHVDALRALGDLEAIGAAGEDALYDALGLLPTAPERRDAGVLVRKGKAVPRLVRREDLRGALHNHTTASDGTASLAEMRDAAAARGLEWLGITEHSVTAAYAGGLDADRLRAQAAEIARMNGSPGCALLAGVESDILEDGALDYAPDVLAALDVVVASVHRRHRLDRAAATARMVAAASHPSVDVLGHPTGRLLLGRPPYEYDMAAVLDAAAANGCAVELNASPHRLDLDATHLAMAKERGLLVSIAADAHSTRALDHLDHGIPIARRAGLSPEDVLNTRSRDELGSWLAARRAKRAVSGGPARTDR